MGLFFSDGWQHYRLRCALFALALLPSCALCGIPGARGGGGSREALTAYESRYVALDNATDGHILQRRKSVAGAYERLFAGVQNRASLRRLRNRDLEAVFRAADTMNFYNPSRASVQDMRLDVHELMSRGLAKRDQLRRLYGALFSARMFVAMRKFYQNWHAKVKLAAPFVVEWRGGQLLHRVLAVTPTAHHLMGRTLDLDDGVKVLVVAEPQCHYSQSAVDAIQRNASLDLLMGRYADWISPVDRNMDIDAFVSWNDAHPNERVAIAYSNPAWPRIKVWSAPVFFFFRNGKLRDKIIGWHGHSTILQLQSEFAKLVGGADRS